jgi:hypothetical protein
MVFTIDRCPVCSRNASVLLGANDGIVRNVADTVAPVVLKVSVAEDVEPEKPQNPDGTNKDPLQQPDGLRPKNVSMDAAPVISQPTEVKTVVPAVESIPTTPRVENPYGVQPIVVAPTPPERLPYVKWAIRGMIFGIVATGCGALAWFPAVGFIYSAVGITLGLIAFIKGISMKKEFALNPGRFRPSSQKMINVSFSLGLLGFILSVIMIFICIATTVAVYD